MATNNFDNFQDPIDVQTVGSGSEVASKTFLARVFSWMFVGLSLTGLLSYVFATTPSLFATMYDSVTHGATGLGFIIMLAPLALVFLMRFAINRLSYPAMVLVFLTYAALTGMSLSVIFMVYVASSIYLIFFVTAALFGIMALLGYTTNSDLTSFGSLLRMLLIGAVIAMVVNIFMHSAALEYVVSFLCVGIFTGLTAYDTQKLKQIGSQINMEAGDATIGKMAIWGALTLYLDFLNLFLSLLEIFGRRK